MSLLSWFLAAGVLSKRSFQDVFIETSDVSLGFVGIYPGTPKDMGPFDAGKRDP